MSVNPLMQIPRYVADGLTFDFTYTYKIYSKLDLRVYRDDELATVDADYTVSGVGDTNGGTVTFVTAPGAAVVVTILPNVPLSQLSTYTSEPFPPARLEKDYDRLAMIAQMFGEALSRALKFKPSSALVDQNVDEPIVDYFLRAKSGGGFDWGTLAAGGVISVPVSIPNGGTGGITASQALTNLGFSTFIKTVIDEPDAAAVRVLLNMIRNDVYTAAGDWALASAAGVLGKLAVGTPGSIPMSRAASALKVAYVPAMTKQIYGFTYANNGTANLDIAAGGAMDATGAYFLVGSATTKFTDVAWAVGTNQGCLDTGAVGNNGYYLWVIGRSDTGVVDYLSSLSSTAPTMPASYDFKRLIGWFKRVAGVVAAFHTYELEGGGLEMNWDVPTLDIALANTLTTAQRTDAVKVPLNFSVRAHLNVILQDASAEQQAWIYCPDQTDAAPSKTVAPLANVTSQGTGNIVFPTQLFIRTSSAGLIAARSNLSTVDNYYVSTMGFTWGRRN